MDYKFFLHGIKDILLNPIKGWERIDSENRTVKFVRDSFFFPLIILVSVSAFVGSFFFTNAKLSPVYSLFVGVKCFSILYFTIYATSFILSEITYPLDLGKDFNISFKIIVYSITPFLICKIFSGLFESLLFVNIIGLYGLYIFWTGAEKMLSPPKYKKMPMLIATTVTIFGIFIVTNLVLTKLIDRVYFTFFA
ncbi:MAG: YIP1 family protein [Bacteroidia bacterium]|nr:YIP1 family protein [Bacteroidia bacterium]